MDWVVTSINRQRLLQSAVGLAALTGIFLSIRVDNPFLISFTGALATATIILPFISPEGTELKSSPQRMLLMTIVLILALTVQAWIHLGRDQTLLVFSLTGILYGLIAGGMITGRTTLYLGTAISVGIVQRTTVFFSSTLPIGNDVLVHNQIVLDIIQSGDIFVMESKYLFAPLYHIYTASIQGILEANIQAVIYLGVTIPITIVGALLVFSVARDVVPYQYAGIAAIFFLASDGFIQMTVMPQPTAFGVLFGVLTFAYSLQYFQTGGLRSVGIALGFFLAAILTHQLSVLVIATGVTAIYIGFAIDEVFVDAS